MWRGIKKIISSNNSNHTFPTAIIVNNEAITNPSDIANTFNNYFAKVAIDIQSSISKQFSKKKYYDYLPLLNIESLFLTPTDSTEVSNIIFSLNQNKSDGPNSIPIKILKLLNKDISDQLAILFNQSFSSGIFPSILKTSKIIPIYKKGSKLECSNYRPISLLYNIDKILERLMYNRLYNFLEKKKSYFHSNLVFVYSTSHAMIHLTDKIRHETDKGNYACGIFVDFQKAFDTVDHHILLKKLEYYGVRGIPNYWFASYLSNRKQFVSINGYKSNLADVKCGVPQGSILGPLLFLIFIDDLHAAIKYSELHHFADDTNLLSCNSCVKSINKQVNYDLKNLSNQLKANKILLNVGKIEFVLFTSSKKQLDCDLKIKLNGKRLYETDSVKYLGIQADKRLTWKQQINHVALMPKKANAMLSKLRHVLDIKNSEVSLLCYI